MGRAFTSKHGEEETAPRHHVTDRLWEVEDLVELLEG